MGGSASASWRTLVVVCSLVALGVTGCAGGPGDAADGEPERSSSPSLEPGPPGPVTLTTGRPSGEPTSDIEGLPSEFPGSLEGMPDFAPRPGVPARALYRPSETRGDGSGWDSEEIALFRAGSWTRISLGSVGLEDGLWPGSEPMGTGELSPDGRLVSWDTDDGVAVLDLYRGSTRLLLSGTGPVTGTRWLPGSDLLLAQRPRGADRLVSVGTGTSSASPVETRSATVLPSGDLGRLVPAGDGSRLVVLPADDDVRTRTSRVLDVPAGGPVVQGWGAGSMLALLPRVGRSRPGEMRVVDLDTGRPRGTLRWSGGVGTTLEVHGWVGEEAVLVSVEGALTAWDPSRRIVSRLATLPPSDGGGDRGAVGLSLAPALLTTP